MRIAWFHPAPASTVDAPDTTDVIANLGTRHTIHPFTEHNAHEFVWRHLRAPYDLTVFELGDTDRHAFVWAYLFHYPGILVLRAVSCERSRPVALTRARRSQDLRTERSFSGWDFLRAPALASRLVVVADDAMARDVRDRIPEAQVHTVPMGVTPASLRPSADGTCVFRVFGNRHEVTKQATTRVRQDGRAVQLTIGSQAAFQAAGAPDETADVVVALEWPPTGAPPVAALRSMAAGLPVIVFETEAVAAWPTLDPQTWRPRGFDANDAPVAISIDPRDEEHSLMLALRRLAVDATLRAGVGNAARRWARQHASVAVSAEAWEAVLLEATHQQPVLQNLDLPSHLTADGSAAARAILREIGASVDFLDDRDGRR